MDRFFPFIGTPTHDGRVHGVYVDGLLTAWDFNCQVSRINGTSLPHQRAVLVGEFLKSACTHLLFVDSDIAWNIHQAAQLWQADREFVGGTYVKKVAGNKFAADIIGTRDGALVECRQIGTGFLLVQRAAIERMVSHYSDARYESEGRVLVGLFHQQPGENTEDVSFCRRWRDIGGRVWMHTGVVLPHYDGCTAYVADVSQFAEQPAAAE